MTGATERKILRVGVVTETYPPEINGVANTMRHLVEGLEQRGHRVHLVRPRQDRERAHKGAGNSDGNSAGNSSGGRRETLLPGLPIPGYRGLRFGLPVYRRLRRMWRREPPDTLYISTQGPLGHAALWAARSLGIPTLTGFHTQFHKYSGHYGLGMLTRWIVALLRRFHNRSGATLVPTERLRRELTSLGFENVHVFSRGVDTELFDPRRRSEALRESWGCRPEGLVVLYVGRLAAEKNLALALRAFEGIVARIPDAKLVLVGDGPELEHLRHAHPHLLLTGAKVGVELAAHYASGDLFLFPSLTETFGNVVVEAMASGLPVIAFDYGAAGVCIRNWENGVKVPVGDADAFLEATLEAIGDRARLRAMGAGARSTAAGMSWSRVIGAFEERLLEVAGYRQPAPLQAPEDPPQAPPNAPPNSPAQEGKRGDETPVDTSNYIGTLSDGPNDPPSNTRGTCPSGTSSNAPSSALVATTK